MSINVKTVSVHYERKQNLGDYSSAAIGCTVWADVSDDQDLNDAMQSLWAMAKENVKAQLRPLMKDPTSTQTKEFFLGLPLEKGQS